MNFLEHNKKTILSLEIQDQELKRTWRVVVSEKGLELFEIVVRLNVFEEIIASYNHI
jgi:hypothetical protein